MLPAQTGVRQTSTPSRISASCMALALRMWTGTYGNACSWTCPRCPRADWLPPARRRRTHRPCMSPNAPRDRPAARANVLTLVMHMTDTPALRTLLAEKGLPVPPSIASSDEVAEIGLARLPHGPVHNWGLDDDTAGWALLSASGRRARVLAVEKAS